jgi:Cu(I)/Ag(I) efflux system membrane fusion protein
MNSSILRVLTRAGLPLLLVALLSACSASQDALPPAPGAGAETAVAHAAKHRNPTYVCPMHPQIVRDAPGNCPICGMTLVERREDPATEDETSAIEVDGRLQQALGVRTAKVETRVLPPQMRAPAQVILDEHRINHIHTRVSGWVETLRVHAVGERVNAGDVLLEVYAPDLVAAQEDYLIALRIGGAGSRQQKGAGVRLRQLGMDDGFIEALAKRGSSLLRVPVRAPKSGVVNLLNVRHGMYVEPSTAMMEIADLSEVWVRVDVFPEQLDRLGDGKVFGAFRIPGVPDRVWRGEVEYVYPAIDEITQTIHLRFSIPNKAGLLKIGSFMDASLRGEDPAPALAVPSEAIIRTADGERVVLAEGEGRFRPVEVHLGHSADGYTTILHGLDEGHEVVVSAQFLLDSESSLRAGLGRLGGESGHAH